VVDGTWRVAGQIKGGGKAEHNGIEITVKEGVNEPPLLVAVNKQASRVLWDPNPQLKNFDLGEAAVYTWKWNWKDKEGQEGRGGLYKPVNYKPGHHYPLVIQTHGFSESRFNPSGVFPTAFAARALAAEGIAVLQVGIGGCPVGTPDEGPCAVSYYESAAKQLISEGLVDPDKIGIIGFSRTCFTVMETLTMGSLHLKAASITDGVMADYVQYMLASDNSISKDFSSTIGAQAFGEGLQQWLKRSPGFNLDKINAPLLVVGSQGPWSLLFMWQPYAGVHYLKKPVELVMLHTHEHVLTNPAARLASQGGTVDWFRFWLQDYEDPDPTKAEQYTRWRQLRNLQEQNDKGK
jgi:dipeptidyl aminopeptidase/acylaminoacyl peptidase